MDLDESSVHVRLNKTNMFLSSSLRSTPLWESSVVTKRLELLLTYIRSKYRIKSDQTFEYRYL